MLSDPFVSGMCFQLRTRHADADRSAALISPSNLDVYETSTLEGQGAIVIQSSPNTFADQRA